MLYECGITHLVSNCTSSQHAHKVTQPVLPWLTKHGSCQGFLSLLVCEKTRSEFQYSPLNKLEAHFSCERENIYHEIYYGKNEDVSPETAGCRSDNKDVDSGRKICIVYFFWTVYSEQNIEHKYKTILSPPYGPPYTGHAVQSGHRCLSLCCSNPARDAIACTALESLSLPDPWASVCLTLCTWLLPILALLIWSTETEEKGVGWGGSNTPNHCRSRVGF